jgi:hypothetical protein
MPRGSSLFLRVCAQKEVLLVTWTFESVTTEGGLFPPRSHLHVVDFPVDLNSANPLGEAAVREIWVQLRTDLHHFHNLKHYVGTHGSNCQAR